MNGGTEFEIAHREEFQHSLDVKKIEKAITDLLRMKRLMQIERIAKIPISWEVYSSIYNTFLKVKWEEGTSEMAVVIDKTIFQDLAPGDKSRDNWNKLEIRERREVILRAISLRIKNLCARHTLLTAEVN